MKERNKHPSVLTRAAELFDLPGEVLAKMPRITLTGNRRVHIDCHRGILEYTNTLIAVNGGSVILKIHGERLDIASMSAEELLIMGEVSRLELE